MVETKRNNVEYTLLIILILEAIKVLCFSFNIDIIVINTICHMIDDARFLLTVVIFGVCCLVLKENIEHKKRYAILCFADLVLIYRLYSDEILIKYKMVVQDALSGQNIKVLVFWLVIIIIVITCICLIQKRKSIESHIGDIHNKNTADKMAGQEFHADKGTYKSAEKETEFQKENDNDVYEGQKSRAETAATYNEDKDEKNYTQYSSKLNPPQLNRMSIFFSISIFAVLIPVCEQLVMQYKNIESIVPSWWDLLETGLIILFIVGMASTLVAVIFFLVRGSVKESNEWNGIATIVALIGSVVILSRIYSGKTSNTKLLDNFLDGLTNNSIVAIVIIPISLFLIIKFGLDVLLSILSRGTIKNKRVSFAENMIQRIEEGLMLFVGTLFDGIISLFLFIPDFLNEISGLLLERDDLFPSGRKDSTRDENKEKNDEHQEGKQNS